MAELADAHGLGPCAERRAGSSPVPGTTSFQPVENMSTYPTAFLPFCTMLAAALAWRTVTFTDSGQ